MSDMVESIEYVPLETKDECLIRATHMPSVSKNYIALLATDNGHSEAFLFKRNGSFVCKVGSKGGGPGEYSDARYVCLDEERNRVIVCDIMRMLYYDLKGKFIKSVHVDLRNGWLLLYLNRHFVFGSPSRLQGNRDHIYVVRDEQMNIINSGVKPLSEDAFKGASSRGFAWAGVPVTGHTYNNIGYVTEAELNDTVYRVNSSSFNFMPAYTINFGKYTTPPDIKANPRLFMQRMDDYAHLYQIFETDKYIMLNYRYVNLYYVTYDKANRQLTYLDSKTGVPNDLDGGFDYWPTQQVNNEMYIMYDAPDFLEQYEKRKVIQPKSPAAANKLKALVNKLDEEDYPVLVIMKVK
jgi:hypothetical protein